jgi:Uncharacterized protein conserved in bacteria (DUF2188)
MPNQHVVPQGKNWGVKPAGGSKLTKAFDKKQDAIDYATLIAQNQKTELIVHKADGTIQNKNSFGNDPNPPKDMKP